MAQSDAPSPPYRLAAFDFDGVLVDSAAWMRALLPEVCRTFGLAPVDDAEIEALRDLPNREIVKRMGAPWWKLPAIARHVRERATRDAASMRLQPGIEALFARLADSGVTTAIVTSNAEATVRAALGAAIVDGVAVIDGGIGLFGKARRLKALARRLRVPPASAVYVGDETRDVDAAAAAGFRSAAVTWGYATRGVLAAARPDYLIEDVGALGRLLAPG